MEEQLHIQHDKGFGLGTVRAPFLEKHYLVARVDRIFAEPLKDMEGV